MLSYGPLARSVADLRLAVSVIEGPDGRHWEVPRAEPVRPEAEPPSPDRVRLKWSASLPHAAVDDESARVVRESAARLAAAGCSMEDAAPEEFDMHDALEWWGEINGFEMGVMTPVVLRLILRHGTYLRLGRSRWSRGLRGGLALKPRRYFAALAARDELISGLEGFLAGCDGWLLPTAPVPAFPHTRPGNSIPVNQERTDYAMAIASYAAPFNLTGSPVVVIPAGRNAEGLPIGLQLVGRRWDDDRLLAVAERVGAILGGFRPPPGY
jgi:amidase